MSALTARSQGGTRAGATGLGQLLRQAGGQLPEALRKLDPRHLWRSPVMFLVWLG